MLSSSTNSNKRRIVAVVGSSGGGTATLGHTNASELLRSINEQLKLIGAAAGDDGKKSGTRAASGATCCIGRALYVNLEGGKSLDSADEEDFDNNHATLYEIHNTDDSSPTWCRVSMGGSLKEVNAFCRERQEKNIAEAIKYGDICGLICISMDPYLFRETLEAAASMKIPVTGSGGTSLSKAAAKFGIQLVGNAGGSVATTTFTRSVSYAHAFASYWNLQYQPWNNNQNEATTAEQQQGQQQGGGGGGPATVSILNACLPTFWGVCLLKHVLKYLLRFSRMHGLVVAGHVDDVLEMSTRFLEDYALPSACAVIMATSSSSNDSKAPQHTQNQGGQQQQMAASSLIMASIVASTACSRSILGGILAGKFLSLYTERLLYWCVFMNIPATMTNMATGGGIGAFVALMMLPIAPILRWITSSVRSYIIASVLFFASPSSLSPLSWLLPTSSIGYLSKQQSALLQASVGGLWGALSCYGSKVGYYHALHLPLILIEMESGNASFLGAIDELSLVLVCSGICAANVLAAMIIPKATSGDTLKNADVALSLRGLRINLLCGDFIEACYPFMERSWLINMGGYLGSAFSSAWLVYGVTSEDEIPKSLAYLPLPASLALAGPQWFRFTASSVLAMGIPFLATLLHHLAAKRKVSIE